MQFEKLCEKCGLFFLKGYILTGSGPWVKNPWPKQVYQFTTLGQTALFCFRCDFDRVPKDLRDEDSRHEETRVAQQALQYA